jgi:hypothetical protein
MGSLSDNSQQSAERHAACPSTSLEVGVPTLLQIGPYRFFFHSREHVPPHVHVESADATAVFNLAPAELVRARGYTRRRIGRIQEIVTSHEAEFLGRWHEYFDR